MPSVFILLSDSDFEGEHDTAADKIVKAEITIKLTRVELFTKILSFMDIENLTRTVMGVTTSEDRHRLTYFYTCCLNNQFYKNILGRSNFFHYDKPSIPDHLINQLCVLIGSYTFDLTCQNRSGKVRLFSTD